MNNKLNMKYGYIVYRPDYSGMTTPADQIFCDETTLAETINSLLESTDEKCSHVQIRRIGLYTKDHILTQTPPTTKANPSEAETIASYMESIKESMNDWDHPINARNMLQQADYIRAASVEKI